MLAASEPDEPARTWQTLRQALDDGFHSIDRRLKRIRTLGAGTFQPGGGQPTPGAAFYWPLLTGSKLDKQRIDSKIAEVQAMLNGSSETTPSASEGTPAKHRRKRSAAVRKRMAGAQKVRWAKIKGEPASVSPEPPKGKAPDQRGGHEEHRRRHKEALAFAEG
jgi:hypothetical protein